MKTLLFFSTLLLCFSLATAQSEKNEITTEFTISTDGDMPDSVNQKIKIITEDLDVLRIAMQSVIGGTTFERPSAVSKEEYDAKITDIMAKSMEKFSGENQELFSGIIVGYLNNFSLEELKSLHAFYQTELGAKAFETQVNLIGDISGAKIKFKESIDSVYEEEFGSKKMKKSRKNK